MDTKTRKNVRKSGCCPLWPHLDWTPPSFCTGASVDDDIARHRGRRILHYAAAVIFAIPCVREVFVLR